MAVLAPRHIRHRRLANRPNRPFTQEEARLRDWSEIENLEKGGPIAMADHFLINDTSTDLLYEKIDKILEEIDF